MMWFPEYWKDKSRLVLFVTVKVAALVIAIVTALIISAGAAMTNDSTAQLAAGGLVLSRTDKIELMSEDLVVSADQIHVDYVFRNLTNESITTLVAFPMPDLSTPPDFSVDIPLDSANFLDFRTTVDGKPVVVNIEQRVKALGIDRTDLLRSMEVPFEPQLEATLTALDQLPNDKQEELQNLGMLTFEVYYAGDVVTRHARPLWTLSTIYYWSQVFAGNQEISVSHSYKPSVGSSVQTFVGADTASADDLSSYRQRYCMDRSFEQGAGKLQNSLQNHGVLGEFRLEYILKTGANWGGGSIGKFRLVVDKGDPRNLVSFCMDNVRKISPTQFETIHTDYFAERNLEVLILKPVEFSP